MYMYLRVQMLAYIVIYVYFRFEAEDKLHHDRSNMYLIYKFWIFHLTKHDQ